MALVVQKFGGTSVADPQKILVAAQKAVARHQAGDQVVVVVSAMGHQTDVLVDLARQITDRPSARDGAWPCRTLTRSRALARRGNGRSGLASPSTFFFGSSKVMKICS